MGKATVPVPTPSSTFETSTLVSVAFLSADCLWLPALVAELSAGIKTDYSCNTVVLIVWSCLDRTESHN